MGKEGDKGDEEASYEGMAKSEYDESLGHRASHNLAVRSGLLNFPIEVKFWKPEQNQKEGEKAKPSHGIEIGMEAKPILQNSPQHRAQAESRKEGYGKHSQVPTFSVLWGDFPDIGEGNGNDHGGGETLDEADYHEGGHAIGNDITEGNNSVYKQTNCDKDLSSRFIRPSSHNGHKDGAGDGKSREDDPDPNARCAQAFGIHGKQGNDDPNPQH